MSGSRKSWLNRYHADVLVEIAPLLDGLDAVWLERGARADWTDLQSGTARRAAAALRVQAPLSRASAAARAWSVTDPPASILPISSTRAVPASFSAWMPLPESGFAIRQ